MKAILSPYDKAGLVDFAKSLTEGGFELVGTGNTHKEVAAAGIPIQQVSHLTGFPEILDGRVKTLHPVVHAGILARRDLHSHSSELVLHNIGTIDLVACNLYPFVDTVSRLDVTLEDALENIDIGGPTMIRAAAKNFPDVIVVVDPADYAWVADRLSGGGSSNGASAGLTLEERKRLAQKAFQHVALYDTAISTYLANGVGVSRDQVTVGYTRLAGLRYGENPHQDGSVYAGILTSGGIVNARQLHGPELSYTNILDADGAWTTVSDFPESAAAVIKHTNPCGLAVHEDQPTAYRRAFEGDSVSAYGGIVSFNRTVTAATAEAMKGILYHIIVAPGYEAGALEVLKKRRQLRILEAEPATGPLAGLEVRQVSGGALIQTTDTIDEDPSTWKVVTERKPTEAELKDLAFAWKAGRHIKSNTIVLAKDNTLVGMGTGQPNRVTSLHLALRIAGDKAQGSALASDAYIPFADTPEMAAEGGIKVIAQPGGSIRDDEVIEAADRHDMAMVFTGVRHFRH